MNADESNELRAMVREILRDVMAQRSQKADGQVEPVRIASDHDLAAFVARLMTPATMEKVRNGNLRFTLSGSTPQTAAPSPGTLTGVITEQRLDRLTGAGSIVLGPDAVLTPLARDKARKLGLKIERRR